MKLVKLVSLLSWICITTIAFAQEQQEMLVKATEAFENGDYPTAVYWFKLLEEQEGNFQQTRTQYMFVRSLYETNDFVRTRIESAEFFNLNPPRNSEAYRDVQRMVASLPEQFEADDAAFYKATEMTNIALLKSYLEDFPNGRHRREVQTIIDDYYFDNAREDIPALKKYLEDFPQGKHVREAMAILDDKSYAEAVDKNTPKALATYLEEFPTGRHVGEAKVTLKGWEQAAYEQVLRTDTDSAYQYYLENFPQGEHYREIDRVLETGKDDRYFRAVQQSEDPNRYRSYLKNYPEGNHVVEARKYLAQAWIQLGDQAYDTENFVKARQYYREYLTDFPLGDENEYAQEQIERIEKKQKRLFRSDNRLNRFFIAYHFDTAAYLGFSLGALSQRKPAFYLAARSNLDVFQTYQYEFNDAGISDLTSNYADSEFTGETIQQRAIATMGLTQKIIRPIWIFAGGGARFQQTLYEVAEREDGRTFGTDYARNTDEEFLTWVVEGGIILDLWGIHLRAGLTGVEAQEWHPAFSIGFSFGYR